MTNGAATVTNGAEFPQLLRLFGIVAAFVVLVDAINVLTALHDAARRGDPLPPWEPITWEATSGIGELIAFPLVFAAFRLVPIGARLWGKTLITHVAASIGFSAVHIAVMMGLRMVVYGAGGLRYHIEAGAPIYEYRKDLLAYLVIGALLHVFSPRKTREMQAPAEPTPPTAAMESFDIVEATRTLRVRVEDIVALRSEGNYVQFALADGRSPFMRTTLSRLRGELEQHGFVQTHRSWLINPSRIRGLERSVSGSYVVCLDPGVQAPVSRRSAACLERIKRLA